MRIAIIGSGVAGLVSAHLLHPDHDVVLFEADARLGGHAHTHDMELDGTLHPVDTGFMVFNHRCYPLLTALFDELGIESRPSDMSFSVADEHTGVQWRSSNLATIFAQPRNLFRPSFLRMLVDIVRFNKAAKALLAEPLNVGFTLDDFLAQGRFSQSFIDWYLIPMGAAIWSADAERFAEFPAASLFRFFDNHGLLTLTDQPQWRTVVGGSITYVQAIGRRLGGRVRLNAPVATIERADGDVVVTLTSGETQRFDHVVIATHSDQALRMLVSPTPAEREILSAIGYQSNRSTLHTDDGLMPTRHRARASWNWRRRVGGHAATLTYDLTRLQGVGAEQRAYVTLNQPEAVDPDQIRALMDYAHPIFTSAAIAAQQRHGEISGVEGISYAGAYWGYGFHEDGARSAHVVVEALRARLSEPSQ